MRLVWMAAPPGRPWEPEKTVSLSSSQGSIRGTSQERSAGTLTADLVVNYLLSVVPKPLSKLAVLKEKLHGSPILSNLPTRAMNQ